MNLVTFTLSVAAVYACVCLLAFLLQERLLYFPSRRHECVPSAVGLDYRDVRFETDDGLGLHGWLVPGDPRRPIVLICHGNAGNVSDNLEIIEVFHGLGAGVFAFDYRGYGASEGRPGEEGTYRDADAAWRHLTDHEGYREDAIVAFGHSLGSAVAIELASRRSLGGLIVEASFPSLPQLAARHYRLLPVGLLARLRYDSRPRVKDLRIPKLFLHSRNDEIVPCALGRQLYTMAPEPKTFVEIAGGHNDAFLVSRRIYVRALEEFLRPVAASVGPGDLSVRRPGDPGDTP